MLTSASVKTQLLLLPNNLCSGVKGKENLKNSADNQKIVQNNSDVSIRFFWYGSLELDVLQPQLNV